MEDVPTDADVPTYLKEGDVCLAQAIGMRCRHTA
jgi:hypothetical protein